MPLALVLTVRLTLPPATNWSLAGSGRRQFAQVAPPPRRASTDPATSPAGTFAVTVQPLTASSSAAADIRTAPRGFTPTSVLRRRLAGQVLGLGP